MAVPNPSEVSPWYLRNITQALALDESTGNVYVRTDADINIENANVNVGNVGITSFGNVDISGNITNAGWTGDVIASAYLDADTAHLTTAQTFTGVKTFGTTTKLLQPKKVKQLY